jgi:hypothetical protein
MQLAASAIRDDDCIYLIPEIKTLFLLGLGV